MKHAAIKPSSAAKSTASRVVATIALATAATAVASPAMAHEGGGHGGYDGHSADYAGGYDGGRDGGRHSSAAPRSYEPASYTEPNYDVPQYESQGDCDRNEAQGHGGDWDEADREKVREAVQEYIDEANTPEPEYEVVATAAKPAAPAKKPAPAKAEPVAPVTAETTAPVEAAASEPQVAVQAPGQQWQGAPTSADTAGAELTAYVPNEGASVDAIEQEASALTDATLDAPVRLATTGTEAAALTGAAGALVLGGAGALLVARRSRVRA